jgi:hypothetical protein
MVKQLSSKINPQKPLKSGSSSSLPSTFTASSPRAYGLGESLESHRVVSGVQPLSLGTSGAIGDVPSVLESRSRRLT